MSLFSALLSVIAVATAQVPETRALRPVSAARPAAAGERSPGELRTTVWQGRQVTYEVIDGWAVHGGDIFLGRANEIQPLTATGPGSAPGTVRRDASPFNSLQEPEVDGLVSYVFEAGVGGYFRAARFMAMEDWASGTGLKFVPAAGGPADIAFHALCPFKGGSGCICPSPIAEIGVCGSSPAHELGHALGLGHEHGRPDRDEYVMVSQRLPGARAGLEGPVTHAGSGPYDLTSVMHYRGWESIPPGIPGITYLPYKNEIFKLEAAPSAGDLDWAKRRYGGATGATVISTNPPGLEIVVDGSRVVTPATFYWPTGSVHTLEAPLQNASSDADPIRILGESFPLLFGRWNDGANRVRDFTADPDLTWVEANYIRTDNLAYHIEAVVSSGRVFVDQFDGFDATPRAFTFVSSPDMSRPWSDYFPATQVIRLTNRGDGPERYSVASNRPWLQASPAQASLAAGESAEIAVSALPSSLRPDLHRGELKIVPDGQHAVGLPTIPVVFALLPETATVELGASGENVELCVSATEGLLTNGRPVGEGTRVKASNGDVYALTETGGGFVAEFVPRSQSLSLADDAQVVLRQHGEGDWRIGEDRVESGHRLVQGEHEYVLAFGERHWGLARNQVRALLRDGDLNSAIAGGLRRVPDMAADAAGSIYVAQGRVVQKINASTGAIETMAGGRLDEPFHLGYAGEGGPATDARLGDVNRIVLDAGANVYMADPFLGRVLRVDASTGVIETVAGTGDPGYDRGYGGDGGPATEARLGWITDLAVDAAGNVYVADPLRVRRIDVATGVIETVAGTGDPGYGGDGGPATEATFRWVRAIALDRQGRLYVADLERIRKIDASGTISTLADISFPALHLAADAFGGIYTSNTRRVTRIDAEDGSVAVVLDAGEAVLGEDGKSVGRLEFVHDPNDRVSADDLFGGAIAVDRLGKIVVHAYVEGVGNGVFRLEPLPFAPHSQLVELPGGAVIRLTDEMQGSGWWQGRWRDANGQRYVHGGSEHVIERLDGRWRVTSVTIPLGSGGESIEAEVGTDGSMRYNGWPITDGSLLTATNFDTYRLTTGPGGLRATLVPQEPQQITLEGVGAVRVTQEADGTWRAGGVRVASDGYVVVNGRGYFLERVRGRWQAGPGTKYALRTVVGTTAAAEGIPASEAILNRASGLAVDAVGNVFIADTGNRRIRKVDVAGLIWTVAGTGIRGSGGDGGPAVAAQLDSPGVVAVDGSGNLYFIEFDRSSVRRIDASTGRIETLVGSSAQRRTGSGLGGLAAGPAGNVYVADTGNSLVRKINSLAGTVENLAWLRGYPLGLAGDRVDGLYVAQIFPSRVSRIDTSTGAVEAVAEMSNPRDLALDATGKLYVGESASVHKIDTVTGSIEWTRRFNDLGAVAVDAAGGVYVSEPRLHRVSRIDAGTGEITAFAGADDATGGWEGGPAESARLAGPSAITVDAAGTLFFVDSNRVWKLNASGTVTSLAGTGEFGYSGDSGPATQAQFDTPGGLVADPAGRVYVADSGNHRVRRIDGSGMITTVAGTGESGYSGDGGSATEATLSSPRALAVDSAGNVYVADHGNQAVRKIDTAGTISTLAHNIAPYLDELTDIAVDGAGNVLVASGHNGRELYKVDAASGDVVLVKNFFDHATPSYGLSSVVADNSGNVYVFYTGSGFYTGSSRITWLDPDDPEGTSRVIAWNSGFPRDALRATDAAISVSDMVVDRSGSIWIADAYSRRIRVLERGSSAN